MFKSVLTVAVAVSALLAADVAAAQSHGTSRTRSTTTTTQDGNTTRTETRTTTTSGEVSFDADAAFDALLGMAERRSDPEYQAMRRRSEPARPEDAFGEWVVTDGGRDVGECRFDMRQNGFLGVRRIETHDCPSRLGRMSNWRVEQGEVVLYRGAGDQDGTRLMYVEGRFVGGGILMRRLDDRGPGPELVDDRRYDDGPRRGGWGRSAEDYAGSWRHTEVSSMGMRRQCSVNLTTNPAFGRYAGSSSGCFGTLMFVSSWGYEDGQVVLYSAGGAAVAMFRGRGDRLTAPHEDGELVLYR
jgi:hypothetical protein